MFLSHKPSEQSLSHNFKRWWCSGTERYLPFKLGL